jgi:hypothetical protein
MEMWLSGADKPCAKSKDPIIVTLINGDSIAMRAHAGEVELDKDTLYKLFRRALVDGVLDWEQTERLRKLM